MSDAAELVTVYRSMDATAKEDCTTIVDILQAEGISATIADDSATGVPEGTFEVLVARADASHAEAVIDANPLPDEVEEVDDSEELDLEPIFDAGGNVGSELEAMGIKSLLEANGIAAVMLGNSVLPTLTFQVLVAHDQVENAHRLIAEAQIAGPAAADAGELESEQNPTL